KLIEVQKNINDVSFIYYSEKKESFNKSFEESMIKHADTVQYLKITWKPITKFLLYFVNLLSLEINMRLFTAWEESNYLENLSLPNLKFLKAQRVPSKPLANLIKNTKGHLLEINIYYDGTYNE